MPHGCTAELAMAHERFDDIVRLTSDWVWETDPDLSITMISDRVTKVLGYLAAGTDAANAWQASPTAMPAVLR